MMAMMLPIGFYCGIKFIAAGSQWIASDDEGVTTSSGEKVSYGAITKLNKIKWDKKGIAFVHYQSERGLQRLVIDDWKFEREPTDQIFLDVEAHLTPEQIEGDIPESEKLNQAVEESDEANSERTQ